MAEQMNIFQLMTAPDINDCSEEEAVEIIGNRLGVKFIWNEFFDRWQGRKGKMELALRYSHFFPDVFDGRLFLGADYWIEHGGGSCPCDSIDEATEYFEKAIARWMNGTD